MKSTLISNAEQRPESRISRAIVKEIWKFFSLIEFYKLKFNKTSMNAYLVDRDLFKGVLQHEKAIYSNIFNAKNQIVFVCDNSDLTSRSPPFISDFYIFWD